MRRSRKGAQVGISDKGEGILKGIDWTRVIYEPWASERLAFANVLDF